MRIKGHQIEVNFTLYFTLFIVTFAKGSPLLRVVFSDDGLKKGILQNSPPELLDFYWKKGVCQRNWLQFGCENV